MGYTRGKHEERLRDLNARGKYELIEPLDTKIMKILPEEGSLFAGMYPLGETAANLAKKFSTREATITSTVISNRLRVLAIQGLVVKTNSVGVVGGGRTVWQRTTTATTLLEKKRGSEHGGDGNGTSR